MNASPTKQIHKTIKLLPDIDWVEIPAGEFIYGEEKHQQRLALDTFFIARYPITNAQYQRFIDDGGYEEERWWSGLKMLPLVE